MPSIFPVPGWRCAGRFLALGGCVHVPVVVAALPNGATEPRVSSVLSMLGRLLSAFGVASVVGALVVLLVLFAFGLLLRRMIRRDRNDLRPLIALPEPEAVAVGHANKASARTHAAKPEPGTAVSGPAEDKAANRHQGESPIYGARGNRFEHAEDAEVLMQAELLMSQALPDQAIALLLRHIREAERPMPMAWLTLFDLFTRTGRQAQYEALASGFGTLFNAMAPSWKDLQSDGNKNLEDYPAVMAKVQALWGLPSCRGFLESLLHDDRGGSRQGFLLTAYRDILFLIDIIDMLDQLALEEDIDHALAPGLPPD